VVLAVSSVVRARILVLSVVLAVSGCASQPRTTDAVAPIAVRPGVAERLALMDRFRLHDELRQHMMERPRVWVEEVSDEEAAAAAGEGEGEEAVKE
jgi:hypothetical protein